MMHVYGERIRSGVLLYLDRPLVGECGRGNYESAAVIGGAYAIVERKLARVWME